MAAGNGTGNSGSTTGVDIPISMNSNDSQTLRVTDLISEGPIYGLIEGASSVFLNNDRMIEPSVSSESLSRGPVTITLTNGSSTATINNSQNTEPVTMNAEAGGTTNLVIRKGTGVANVTVDYYHKYKNRVTTSSSFFTSDMITTSTRVGNVIDIVPARLRAIPGTSATPDGIAVEGFLWKRESSTVALWRTGTYNDYSNSTSLIGSYALELDDIVNVQSVNGTTITLGSNWTGTSGTYFFDKLGTLNMDSTLEESRFSQRVEGASVSFRTGTLMQSPMSGAGSTAISTAISLSLEQTDGYGSGSQPARELLGSGNIGLSAAQLEEVDKIKFRITYPNGFKAIGGKGGDNRTYIRYKIEIAIKQEASSSFGSYIVVRPALVHSGNYSNSRTFEHTLGLERFRPFADFKIRISRLDTHENPGYDDVGSVAKSDWTNLTAGGITGTTAILNEKLNHPYTALAETTFSTKEFADLPQRTYHLRGKLIRVPSNYVTREESATGIANHNRNVTSGAIETTYQDWNGSFRTELTYTNNPAWIYFDLLTNNRYGLGDFIEDVEIDKYSLYRIARYCDELVSDGKGGLEPRYTLNTYMTKQADSYKVLKDLATNFLGLLYFLDGKIFPTIDAPASPVYNFTKANVIDGSFSYETTGSKTRINQVVVSWNNADNNYALQPLIVEDKRNIAKTQRIITQEAVAYGCTSEAQATRYGKWKLWTAANQREIVSFSTGISGSYITPGDIINVQDSDRNATRYGGRISNTGSISVTTIPLDSSVSLISGSTYDLSVVFIKPSAFALEDMTVNSVNYVAGDLITQAFIDSNNNGTYTLQDIDSEEDAANAKGSANATTSLSLEWKDNIRTETRAVQNSSGVRTSLSVSPQFSSAPTAEHMWVLTENRSGLTVAGSAKEYRVLGIAQTNKNEYDITAVEHYDSKYSSIDEDFTTYVPEALAPVVTPTEIVPPVTGLAATIGPREEGSIGDSIVVSWTAPAGKTYTVGASGGGTTSETINSEYEHLHGYFIEHNFSNYENPLRVDKNSTILTFKNIPQGTYSVSIRVLNILENKSVPKTINVTSTDRFVDNLNRMPLGLPYGGLCSTVTTLNSSGLFSFDDNVYGFKPLQLNSARLGNTSTNTNTYQLSISGMPTITWTAQSEPGTFIHEHHYMIMRADVTSNMLKLLKYNKSPSHGVPYWFDAGNGSETTGLTSITGSLLGSFEGIVTGSGTAFTTELQVGAVLVVGSDAARVSSIKSDTILYIDRAMTISNGSSASTNNYHFDFTNDTIISRVYKETNAGYQTVSFLSLDTTLSPQLGITRLLYALVTNNGSAPSVNSNAGTFADPAAGAATGWQLSVPTTTNNGDLIYAITRVLTSDGKAPQDAAWSAPFVYASRQDGERGAGRWHIQVSSLPTTSALANTRWGDGSGNQPSTAVVGDQAFFYTGTLASPTAQKVWIYAGSNNWTEQTEVIDGDLLVQGTITADRMVANTITANEIATNTLTANEIATDTLTANEIATNTLTANEIAANAITASEISADAVTTDKLAAGAVTADEIGANAITTVKLAAGAVTADEIGANAITTVKLAAGAVTADEIGANAITAAKISAGAVTASEIAAGAITAGKIAADAVTATEIDVSNLAALNANLGAVTAGTLKGGSIPDANAAPSGSEAGAFMDLTGGKMVFGKASKHILFDGTDLILSGVTIDANSIVNSTAGVIVKEDSVSEATTATTLNFTTGLNVAVTGSAPTQIATISLDSGFATQSFVTTAIDNLIDGAPGTLNTLNEIAEAIADNDDFSGAMTTSLAGKVGTSSSQALTSASNALTISGNTITLTRGDTSTDTVTVPDNNTQYTAGTGLQLVGTEFRNTSQDQTVSIAAGSNITVSGTYPNFTIASSFSNTQRTDEEIRDLAAGIITAGTNVSVVKDDAANTVTISSTDTNTQRTDEEIRDLAASIITAGTNVSVVKNDAADTVTISSTDTVYTHPAYTPRSINTSGATVLDTFTSDNIGSVTGIGTRTLTLADLGYTGATDANRITDNSQIANGRNFTTNTGTTTASNTQTFTNKSGDISQWTNDAAYVTSSGNTIIGTDSDINTSGALVIDQLNMTDGVIQSHSTRTLTLANLGYTGATDANKYVLPFTDNSSNWNTAYSWGDHGDAGYLTSQTSHADVVVDGDFTSNGILKRTSAGNYGIVTDNSNNWNTAYGWGDHGDQGYQLASADATNATQLGGYAASIYVKNTDFASASTGGVIKLGYNDNGKNYAVELSSNQAYVNVPWENTVYTHPAFTARNINTSGATVIDVFTSNAIGSVTNITTRTMTLADLGLTDNSSNWNTAYNNHITGVGVSGTTTKTITLTQQDGGTLTTTWADLNGSNDYVDSLAFNTSNGILTVGRTGSLSNLTVDLDGRFVTSSGNTIIGTDLDISATGSTVISAINMTDGVIQSHSTRTLTLGDLGFSAYSHPNHSGDVTSSGDGATTIANNAVTFAKMQDIATDTFMGRTASGSGDAKALSTTEARTMLNVADGANNYSFPYTVSASASNSTVVQRHSSGYIFANYFNTTPNTVTSGITQVCVETGNDGYIRHGTAAAVRTFINVDNGADVTPSWVPSSNPGYLTSHQDISGKANLSGATFSGDVTFSGGAGAVTITSSDIRSAATSTWTGDPGANGKIQYHSNRWYIVADSSSNRIVQFRRNNADKSYIDNNGKFIGDTDQLDGQHGSYYLAYGNFTGTPTIPSGNQIIDWTTDQGVTNIHAGNYLNTNTTDFNVTVESGTAESFSAGNTLNFTGSGSTTVSRSGKTVDISSTNTDRYVNSASFATSTGVLTLTRAGSDSATVTVDLDGRYVTSSGNTVIGTDSDIDTSGAQVLDTLVMTDGVITSHSLRTLTLANLGYTGATNATANAGTVTSVVAGQGLTGGTITSSGTIALSTNMNTLAVSVDSLAANKIDVGVLDADAVISRDIRVGASGSEALIGSPTTVTTWSDGELFIITSLGNTSNTVWSNIAGTPTSSSSDGYIFYAVGDIIVVDDESYASGTGAGRKLTGQGAHLNTAGDFLLGKTSTKNFLFFDNTTGELLLSSEKVNGVSIIEGQNKSIGVGIDTSITPTNKSVLVGFGSNGNGYGNTSIGAQAGSSISDSGVTGGSGQNAAENTSLGLSAGYSLSTGSKNVFLGSYVARTQAGYTAIPKTGDRNIGIGGHSATADVLGGTTTFSRLSSGSNNIALGSRAAQNLSTGDSNIFIGTSSGYSMTTGSNNVIIGMFSGNAGGYDIRTSSNNLVLSDGAGNIKLKFDTSANATFTGKVTTSGTLGMHAPLLQAGDGTQSLQVAVSSSYNYLDSYVTSSGASKEFRIKMGQGSSTKFTLDTSGNGTFVGNVTAYSDERLKSDIETLDGKKVLEMRGVEFIKDGVKGSGVIAQELEKIAPELVLDGDYKSVAYGNLTGYLIEAIKQQQSEINELKDLVKQLLEK